jgi:NADPH-dependent curcumin reductase CurA
MNRRIVLAERPRPTASPASFRLETVPIPDLRDVLEGRNFGKLVVSLDEPQGVTA